MANKQTIIGKTAPVPLGQQKAVNSLPVVFAEDQPPIPVEEQNKIQSEVALSLLGIPRAEVALGIFADVNTYDVNPSEWSQFPLENEPDTGTGVNHLATEAGAELVAAEGRTTVLTSKRFFRYQPGRVSSSTMGVKMNRTRSTYTGQLKLPIAPAESINVMKGAPTIKKWGIFDKFDGYYFEIVNAGDKNDFRCIRRTQALVPSEPTGIETTPERWTAVTALTGTTNIKEGNWGVVGVDPVIYRNGLCYVAAAIYDPSLCYAPADVRAIEDAPNTLSDYTYDEGYAVRLAYRDASNNFIEHLAGRQFQFPFDQKEGANPSNYEDGVDPKHLLPNNGVDDGTTYIRLDAHCKWQELVTNLCRGSGAGFSDQINLTEDDLGVKLDVLGTDARFGYDPSPSETDSSAKVWNLLVTVQGNTQITNTEFNDSMVINGKTLPSPFTHRTLNTSGTVGQKNVTLKEWFKLCVPSQYRTVYEWRPVRAMFSNDQLNGLASNTVRWSDVSTANVNPSDLGVKRPGDPVTLVDNEILTDTSVYDVDFSKVTMWKIEFSWYGAVGALFLCYVPVANGEARWVRVHHMRASNQLDVASLGNATLPITYLTHAGLSNGLVDDKSNLVKYGASYYIDGGDKGTVKLLSKSSNYAKSVAYGGLIQVSASAVSGIDNALTLPTSVITKADKDQLIGSYLKSDTTKQVIWVENEPGESVRLYFNGSVSAGFIDLIVTRRQRAMMALRAKDEVSNTTGTQIRNRIQLYPIKYGIGVTDPSSSTTSNILTINFIKNPLLITNNLDNSSLQQDYSIEIYSEAANKANGFNLGSGTVPQLIASGTNIETQDYGDLDSLVPSDGSYLHCYMRGIATGSIPIGGFPASPAVSETAVLVRLFKRGSDIYIQNYSAQSEPFTVYGNFLPVRMYTFGADGLITQFTGDFTHTKYEDQKKWNETDKVGSFESIAQLSGASVSQDFRLSPVANTGSVIFSLYTNNGGAQYDLTDYFAYNKEYISYPLTNEVDILCAYAMWDSTSATSQPSTRLSVVNSLTWEEQ